MRRFLISAAAAMIGIAAQARAQVLFSDSFETYSVGALDKNLSGGPNAAANGTGNPWFGPSPPNGQVVTTDSGVLPHGGNQMVRGAFVSGADFDQNWYNLASRLNGGNPFTGNVRLDWWFYDTLGAGGAGLQDYIALGYYDTAPSSTDYPPGGSLNPGVAHVQRLSLGAASNQNTGFSSQLYQARVVGATDGYSSGWFNTNTARSVGWHHARIDVGPALPDGTNYVQFYIDDMNSATFAHDSIENFGYNVIEMNLKFGNQTAYYDDVTFSSIVPEPGAFGPLAAGALWLARRRRRH